MDFTKPGPWLLKENMLAPVCSQASSNNDFLMEESENSKEGSAPTYTKIPLCIPR